MDEDEGGGGWREEQDLFAVGASAYTLLHGEAPPKGWGGKPTPQQADSRQAGAGRRWRVRRYWDEDTWTAVFEGLVGGCVDGQCGQAGSPSTEQVHCVRGTWTTMACTQTHAHSQTQLTF
jgi:hypothetical protein